MTRRWSFCHLFFVVVFYCPSVFISFIVGWTLVYSLFASVLFDFFWIPARFNIQTSNVLNYRKIWNIHCEKYTSENYKWKGVKFAFLVLSVYIGMYIAEKTHINNSIRISRFKSFFCGVKHYYALGNIFFYLKLGYL